MYQTSIELALDDEKNVGKFCILGSTGAEGLLAASCLRSTKRSTVFTVRSCHATGRSLDLDWVSQFGFCLRLI